MPHMVETMWSGQDRKPWWQGMAGQFANVTSDKGVTWRKALQLAEADWTVEKTPLYALVEGEATEVEGAPVRKSVWSGPSDDFYGLVRSSDHRLLYVVGGRYVPIQNAETFQWAANLVDVAEGIFVTAWVLRGGRIVGCTLELPKEVVVGGKRGEHMPVYLNALNWHGGGALEAHISPVRVECWNTLRASQGSAQSVIHIRHTGDATKKLEIARSTLGITYMYVDEFQRECNELLKASANQKTVLAAYESIWPKPKDESQQKAVTRWKSRRDEILTVWTQSPNLDNVRDTNWGVYNAFTEWSQWGRKFRGANKVEGGNDALRGEEVLFGQARDISEQAFAFLLEASAK